MALTTFDLVALGLLLCCIIVSAMRGLVGELVSVASFLAGLLLAKMFAVPVADVVFANMEPREIAVIFAFVLTYVVARVAVAVLHEILNLFIKKANLSRLNRALGGLLGAIKGIIIIGIGVLACSFSTLPSSEEWQNAKTAPFFESVALLGKHYLPTFLEKQVHFNHDESSLKTSSDEIDDTEKTTSSRKKSSRKSSSQSTE